MSFGLYLHFPFCRSKCRYCDFFSLTDAVPHEAYARAIERECRLREPSWRGRLAQSLYLGGGTPTLWDVSALRRAMDELRARLPFAPAAEWTIEANPGTVDAPLLAACRSAGFNRLSIGVQSFDDAILSSLGRVHSAQQAIEATAAAREAGFESLSLDLIHGLPGQTLEGALADLDMALSLGPDHLSLYELMVDHLESETPLSRDVASGAVRLPDEDEVFEMGRALACRAAQAEHDELFEQSLSIEALARRFGQFAALESREVTPHVARVLPAAAATRRVAGIVEGKADRAAAESQVFAARPVELVVP